LQLKQRVEEAKLILRAVVHIRRRLEEVPLRPQGNLRADAAPKDPLGRSVNLWPEQRTLGSTSDAWDLTDIGVLRGNLIEPECYQFLGG
jgi:hypothetical protein